MVASIGTAIRYSGKLLIRWRENNGARWWCGCHGRHTAPLLTLSRPDRHGYTLAHIYGRIKEGKLSPEERNQTHTERRKEPERERERERKLRGVDIKFRFSQMDGKADFHPLHCCIQSDHSKTDTLMIEINFICRFAGWNHPPVCSALPMIQNEPIDNAGRRWIESASVAKSRIKWKHASNPNEEMRRWEWWTSASIDSGKWPRRKRSRFRLAGHQRRLQLKCGKCANSISPISPFYTYINTYIYIYLFIYMHISVFFYRLSYFWCIYC